MALPTITDIFNSTSQEQFLTPALGYLTLLSLVTFCFSLLLLPWIVSRLSSTYFIEITQPQQKDNNHPNTSFILLILRNILGLLLLIAGIAMLFLPGQGLLTILLSLLLLSLPGKKRLITTLIAKPKIRNSIDWLRMKSTRKPFQWPDFNDKQ